MKLHKSRIAIWMTMLVLISLACNLGGTSTSESIMTVEIASPLDGAVVSVGQPVEVLASVVAEQGVDKVYLSINGQVIATEEVEGQPQTHITSFVWSPVATGEVTLTVLATDGEENVSDPVNRKVTVAEAVAVVDTPTTEALPPSETPTVATDTPVPATATFTPEPIPTNTPTATPTSAGPIFGITLIVPPLFLLPTVQTVFEQVSVPNNDIASATVACPNGTVLMSGGFATNKGVYVYTQLKSGNGWRAYASNKTGSAKTLNAYAVCASGIANAAVQQVLGNVSVPAGGVDKAEASCPAGTTVVGGGYASKGDQTLKVYNSTLTGNGWQVYARNSAGVGQTLNAYALCLSTTRTVSSSQVFQGINISAGATDGQQAGCPSGDLATGGGFALQDGLEVYNSSPSDYETWEGYAWNNSGASRLINVYATCLSFD